ncbi:MAG: polysaccharide biosynthesis/export family protein [Pyrinomonadaceae bacterium]
MSKLAQNLAVRWLLLLFLTGVSPQAFGQVPDAEGKGARESYRIQQGDKLSIKFFSHPELNEPSLVVRPDGFISPQIVDEIRAEGRTVAELKKELERSYVEVLLDPIITVSVVDFMTPRIFVGGQIGKPGRYEMREAKTLVQAIFVAGGFTADAHRRMVIHARPDGRGDWRIQTVDVLSVLDKKAAGKDVVLQDGDYVFVPDSRTSRVSKAVEAFRGFLPRIF